jgi:plasmid stability protein
MGELRIRDVDEDVIAELKSRAKRHGRTLGDELKSVLSDEVRRPRQALADRARQLREMCLPGEKGEPDSAAYIREMRDARG